MSGGPWLDLARLLDDEHVDRLLDAYFADTDPFVASDRAPSKLMSQRVRLLTQGPTLAKTETRRRGATEPTSNEDFKRSVEAREGKGATCAIRDL